MTSPLTRVRHGAVVLGVVLVIAVVGFKFLGNQSWLSALYMVVITISTVGYGETTQVQPAMQVFTIAVILFGLSAAAYTFGGIFEMVLEGEVDRALGMRRQTRDIEKLKGHTVICGFGRMGTMVADELAQEKEPFVVIDSDPDQIVAARNSGYLAIAGDATEESELATAGIERAKSLVTVLPTDANNVFITLTARNMNPELHIIARGELPTTHKKLLQAGANRVVMPAAIGASRMAAMITRPATLELMEVVIGRSTMDIEMAELRVTPDSPMIGKSVVDVEARRKHQLLVVAVKQAAGDMVFNPDSQLTFARDDIVIVMGKREDIEKFRNEFRL